MTTFVLALLTGCGAAPFEAAAPAPSHEPAGMGSNDAPLEPARWLRGRPEPDPWHTTVLVFQHADTPDARSAFTTAQALSDRYQGRGIDFVVVTRPLFGTTDARRLAGFDDLGVRLPVAVDDGRLAARFDVDGPLWVAIVDGRVVWRGASLDGGTTIGLLPKRGTDAKLARIGQAYDRGDVALGRRLLEHLERENRTR